MVKHTTFVAPKKLNDAVVYIGDLEPNEQQQTPPTQVEDDLPF